MSLAEQLTIADYQSAGSAPREIAKAALASLLQTDSDQSHYRPDYMTEAFAHEVASELKSLGLDAAVVASWLTNVRSQQGRSFAIDIEAHTRSNVIPFRARS